MANDKNGTGWIITTVAGTGVQGHAGDGGPARAAALNNPFDVAFDADGNMIFSDTFNHRLCRVDAVTQVITTIAGSGERGFGGDGGPATRAQLNEPYGVTVDRAGTVFFADRLNRRVRRVAPDGSITTLAELQEPNGVALDPAQKRLFVTDVADHRVQAIDLDSASISVFAGTGQARHDGDGGPATQAGIFGARAVAVASDGSVYVMERQGSSIRRIRAGIIETIAGTGGHGYAGDGGDARLAVFDRPKEMALDPAGNIYVVDTENHAIRMIDVNSWIVRTIAGTGTAGPGGDGGPAAQAKLARPHGAAVGPDGALYIGDSENHRIRKLVRQD